MHKLSTGQDSTLGEYRKLAGIFGPKAVAFIDKKIAEDPDREAAEVVADESQMIYLFSTMLGE